MHPQQLDSEGSRDDFVFVNRYVETNKGEILEEEPCVKSNEFSNNIQHPESNGMSKCSNNSDCDNLENENSVKQSLKSNSGSEDSSDSSESEESSDSSESKDSDDESDSESSDASAKIKYEASGNQLENKSTSETDVSAKNIKNMIQTDEVISCVTVENPTCSDLQTTNTNIVEAQFDSDSKSQELQNSIEIDNDKPLKDTSDSEEIENSYDTSSKDLPVSKNQPTPLKDSPEAPNSKGTALLESSSSLISDTNGSSS